MSQSFIKQSPRANLPRLDSAFEIGRPTHKCGFSLSELIAVLAILGVLAALIVPRVSGNGDEAKRAACFMNQGEIELQVQLWRRSNGTNPAANLSDIGANSSYFPQSLPNCPVDGSAYTIDTTSGFVIGHTH